MDANAGVFEAVLTERDVMISNRLVHASGFIGKTGRGIHEHCGVYGRTDIITTTLGKAQGGVSSVPLWRSCRTGLPGVPGREKRACSSV